MKKSLVRVNRGLPLGTQTAPIHCRLGRTLEVAVVLLAADLLRQSCLKYARVCQTYCTRGVSITKRYVQQSWAAVGGGGMYRRRRCRPVILRNIGRVLTL